MISRAEPEDMPYEFHIITLYALLDVDTLRNLNLATPSTATPIYQCEDRLPPK